MAAGALALTLIACGQNAEPPRLTTDAPMSSQPAQDKTSTTTSPPTTVTALGLPSGDTGGTTTSTVVVPVTRARRSAVPPSTIVRPSTSAPLPVKTGGRPSGDVWARLRICESGGNYGANTGNGFFGAYQFSKTTWLSVGRTGMPHLASPAEQDAAARDLQARSGWGQWPACSRRLGLR